MLETKVNVSTVWKTVTKVETNVAGVWKTVSGIWIKQAGIWEQVFTDLIGTLNGTSAAHTRLFINSCSAGVTLHTDGNEYAIPADSVGLGDDLAPHWLTEGSNTEFWARCTQNSGDALTGASSALNTWLALSTTRNWLVNASGVQVKNANLTIELAIDAAGTLIIADQDYVIKATSFTI